MMHSPAEHAVTDIRRDLKNFPKIKPCWRIVPTLCFTWLTGDK
ncbi:hypothetical protein [Methanosarcina sp. WWM596]|nr:hypothetical protein [Methanosarcina sp. WWM596]